MTTEAEPGCPKRMVYGPCGGVRADLSCELGDRPCPFTTRPQLRWDGPPVAPAPVDVPLVLTDLTVRPYDPGSVRRVVKILAPVSDGLLVGEHHNRPDLPPTLFATEVLAAGGRPWTTLTCRDRNRIVLEQELVGLRALGVEGVLCVTGDARGQGVRPDVTQVFDLDGTRLAALAASLGVPVAVPEAPDAPPVALRPDRVAQKQRAGAALCVLNHVGTPERVGRFVAAARAAGATLPFVAAVAVYTDAESARVLQRFPGLAIDPAAVAAVLASPDPFAAGVDAAVVEAEALLAIPGVAGVNLSGLGRSGGEEAAAEAKAAIAVQIRQRVGVAS
ncbi:MAG TPA: methylenetetrahydrofolate reductase [Mycobacteriales bacterium]